MDLVDDERVALQNVAFLEPPPGDSGGDDDDVPRRGLRRCLTLAVDTPALQVRGSQNLLGDRPDRKRFSRARAADDPTTLARSSELANSLTVVLLEIRLDVEVDRELNGLALGPGRRDDDDPPPRQRYRYST